MNEEITLPKNKNAKLTKKLEEFVYSNLQ